MFCGFLGRRTSGVPTFRGAVRCPSSHFQRSWSRLKGKFELTPHGHSHIVGRATDGQNTEATAEDHVLPPSTKYSTIARADSRYETGSLLQSGCPRIVTDSLFCLPLCKARANFKIQYKEVRLNLDLDGKNVSKATRYRIFKEEGTTN